MYLVLCQILAHPGYILRTDRNERGIGDYSHNIILIACKVKLRVLIKLMMEIK